MTNLMLIVGFATAAVAALVLRPTWGLVTPTGTVPVIPRKIDTRPFSRDLRALVAVLAAALLVAASATALIDASDRTVSQTTSLAASAPELPYRASDPRPGALPGEMANVASMIGATAAWSHGLDGTGVGVAVIDSGVSRVAGLEAPGAVIDGPDFTVDAGTAAAHVDAAGHGTHLAGIIAARPTAAAGAAGDFTGIAPGAELINLKARAANGTTDVASVVAAVRWATEHRNEHNIRVLNLAFNTTGPSAELAAALDDAWRAGLVVVVSAGNNGSADTSLLAPANDPNLISVGASDPAGTVSTADDGLASFSSRGNEAVQPSLVAPGRSIVSATAPGSEAAAVETAQVAPGLMKGTGTSQASAVVSGAAALLLQQRPGLTPDQVKASLLASADPLAGEPVGSGAGLIDIARSLTSPTPVFDSLRPTPAAFAGIASHKARSLVAISPWNSNSWGSNSWGSNSWGSNSWGSNSWGSNSWGSNSWGSNSWGSNSWGSNSWGSNSWGSNSWGSNSWGSNCWGSNSWGSNSWGSNSWG